MMHWKAGRLALALVAGVSGSLDSAAAAQAPGKATIAINFPGDDPLTTNFRNALLKRIAEDEMLELSTDVNQAAIQVVSPAGHIDWDTLDGRIVAIYIVNVKSVWRGSFRLSGVCFANDLKKCIRDFVRRTKIYALPPARSGASF